MAEKAIKHISGDLSTIEPTQLGVEDTVDPVLGYRLWGGKDVAGILTHWLARNKPGQLLTIQLTGPTTVGVGIGFLKHDASGQVTGGNTLGAGDLPDHNFLNGVNDGDFQHLSAIEKALLHDLVTVGSGQPFSLSGQTLSLLIGAGLTVNGGNLEIDLSSAQHADLGGLSADDHTQYSKADGSRAFTGKVGGIDATLPTELATLKNVTDAVGSGTWVPVFEGLMVDDTEINELKVGRALIGDEDASTIFRATVTDAGGNRTVRVWTLSVNYQVGTVQGMATSALLSQNGDNDLLADVYHDATKGFAIDFMADTGVQTLKIETLHNDNVEWVAATNDGGFIGGLSVELIEKKVALLESDKADLIGATMSGLNTLETPQQSHDDSFGPGGDLQVVPNAGAISLIKNVVVTDVNNAVAAIAVDTSHSNATFVSINGYMSVLVNLSTNTDIVTVASGSRPYADRRCSVDIWDSSGKFLRSETAQLGTDGVLLVDPLSTITTSDLIMYRVDYPNM